MDMLRGVGRRSPQGIWHPLDRFNSLMMQGTTQQCIHPPVRLPPCPSRQLSVGLMIVPHFTASPLTPPLSCHVGRTSPPVDLLVCWLPRRAFSPPPSLHPTAHQLALPRFTASLLTNRLSCQCWRHLTASRRACQWACSLALQQIGRLGAMEPSCLSRLHSLAWWLLACQTNTWAPSKRQCWSGKMHHW